MERKRLSRAGYIALFAAAALAAAVLSLCLGAVTVSPGELAAVVFGGQRTGTAAQILLYVRIPRTLGCLLAGAALACSGAIIQTVLANPLAAPNIIGVNSGAGVGAALCCALFPTAAAALPFAAFAGAAVSFAGLLGFVGLIAPHMARRLVGSEGRFLLPACAFGGAALLTVCDILARVLFAPYELPVGIVLSLAGGPFFLWLLFRRGASHP